MLAPAARFLDQPPDFVDVAHEFLGIRDPADVGDALFDPLDDVFTECLQRAYALGFRAMRLDTYKKNDRALALYRKLGYAERGDVRFRKGVFACFEKALRPGFPP